MHFLVSALAFLGAFALRQIEHESDTLIPAFLEGRYADQYGNTAAVFPEVLLLKRWKNPGHLVLLYQSRVAIAPLRRREVRPPYTACDEVLMIVPHDVEKGFIGLQNPAVEIPDKDADDVGLDQAADLPFLGAGDVGVKPHRLHQQNDQDDGRGE